MHSSIYLIFFKIKYIVTVADGTYISTLSTQWELMIQLLDVAGCDLRQLNINKLHIID